MSFLGALLMLVLTTLVILPLIMFAGIVAFDWWPVLLFLVWSFVALVRGRIF